MSKIVPIVLRHKNTGEATSELIKVQDIKQEAAPEQNNTNTTEPSPDKAENMPIDLYAELRQSLSKITYHSSGELFRLANIVGQVLTRLEQLENK